MCEGISFYEKRREVIFIRVSFWNDISYLNKSPTQQNNVRRMLGER